MVKINRDNNDNDENTSLFSKAYSQAAAARKNLEEYKAAYEETQKLINSKELYRRYDKYGNVEAAMDELALDYWSRGRYDYLVGRAEEHGRIIKYSDPDLMECAVGTAELKSIMNKLRENSDRAFEEFGLYDELPDIIEMLEDILFIYDFDYLRTEFDEAVETRSRGFRTFKRHLEKEYCAVKGALADYRENRHLIFFRRADTGREYLDICIRPIFVNGKMIQEAYVYSAPRSFDKQELDEILSECIAYADTSI